MQNLRRTTRGAWFCNLTMLRCGLNLDPWFKGTHRGRLELKAGPDALKTQRSGFLGHGAA